MASSVKKTKKKSLAGKAEDLQTTPPPADLKDLTSVLESMEKDVKATAEQVSELRKRIERDDFAIDKGVSFLDVWALLHLLTWCRLRMSFF